MNAPRIREESAYEHLQNAMQLLVLGCQYDALCRIENALEAWKEGNLVPGDYGRVSNEAGRF